MAGRRIECKTRKRFIGQFLGWLEGNDALFVKEDRSETLVVINLDEYARLLKPQATEDW